MRARMAYGIIITMMLIMNLISRPRRRRLRADPWVVFEAAARKITHAGVIGGRL